VYSSFLVLGYSHRSLRPRANQNSRSRPHSQPNRKRGSVSAVAKVRNSLIRDPTMTEVTFSDFAKLANKRGLTPERLTERFAGKIEKPGEFFDRIFKTQYAGVLISYRSVLAFYSSELQCHQDSIGQHNVCACGCGQAVFDRKKWASSRCKKRMQRRAA